MLLDFLPIRLTAISENEDLIFNTMDKVENLPTDKARLIKTHFSWDMLPTDAKEKNVKV